MKGQENTPFWRWLKVCFGDLNKEMFLKSKMKNVVKYDVYLDRLIVGSIYVTKTNKHIYIYIYIYIWFCIQGKPEIPVALQTPSSRL